MLNTKSEVSDQGTDYETALYDQHYYASLAYVFYLSERVRIKPSMLLKAVQGAPVSIDYNALFTIDEKYSAGLYLRNNTACGLLTQIRFAEVYRLAYAFEMPLKNSVGPRFSTHEISFGLNMALLRFHKNAITNF